MLSRRRTGRRSPQPLPRSTKPLTGVLCQPENRTSSDVRVPVIFLFLLTFTSIHIQFPVSFFFSFSFFFRHVYPYNPIIGCRASVTTPTTPGEPFAAPSPTYARLRARRRRPSRRRTPSREFVTCPASAAVASSRLGALRALTAFKSSAASPRALGSSGAGSDAMHWVERDVLSLPMPSFDDDIREDYRVNTLVYFSSLSPHVIDVHTSVLGPSASEDTSFLRSRAHAPASAGRRAIKTVFHHQRERQKQAHFWEEVGAQRRKNDGFVVTAAVRVERDVAHSHHSDSATLEECTPPSYQARLTTVAVVGLVIAVGNSQHTNCTFLQVGIVFHIDPSHNSNQHPTPFIGISDIVIPWRSARYDHHSHRPETSSYDDRFPAADVVGPVVTVGHSNHCCPFGLRRRRWSRTRVDHADLAFPIRRSHKTTVNQMRARKTALITASEHHIDHTKRRVTATRAAAIVDLVTPYSSFVEQWWIRADRRRKTLFSAPREMRHLRSHTRRIWGRWCDTRTHTAPTTLGANRRSLLVAARSMCGWDRRSILIVGAHTERDVDLKKRTISIETL
ncbi:hypothetical protein B0H13DRAFT_2267686 [Mycena leptocephala]|nr:hypothetical protein B0H13DRAFT_2267686 [Mycena leptocephala]